MNRQGVRKNWRILHCDELPDLQCRSNIISVIKSRRMGCVGRAARVEENRIPN